MKPSMFSVNNYEQNGVGWSRIGDDIEYTPTVQAPSNSSGGNNGVGKRGMHVKGDVLIDGGDELYQPSIGDIGGMSTGVGLGVGVGVGEKYIDNTVNANPNQLPVPVPIPPAMRNMTAIPPRTSKSGANGGNSSTGRRTNRSIAGAGAGAATRATHCLSVRWDRCVALPQPRTRD